MLEVRRLEEKSNEYAEAMRTASAWDLQVKQARERTTFFLNDPDELKKDRVPGEDEACGPASMARFSGEDRSAGDRKRIQAAQLRNWCDQITQEKQAAKQQEREADMKHAQYLRQVDEIREQMVVQERGQRLQDAYQNAAENRRFAEMRRAEQQAILQQEKELDAMHNRTIMSDPMMLERRDQAISAIPGRVRRDHWKGMTVPQLEQIYATQQQQAQEKAVAAAKTAAEQQAYGDATNAVVDILQRQHEAERIRAAEDAMRVKQEQLVQAHEKRVRDVEMNKILNTNQVSDGFFNRFGASCR